MRLTETDPTLAAIDAALRDYSVSADAMRWTPNPARMPAASPLSDADAEAIARALAEIGRAATEAGRRIFAAFTAFGEHLQAAGIIPPPAPADPRGRALTARLARSSGPPSRLPDLRLPRHLDRA